MSTLDVLQIAHDPLARRFTVVVEGEHCELTYQLTGSVLTITHTGVPAAVGGRGIAAQLMQAALSFVRRQGFRLVPSCSYAAAYLRRHPEQRDLLA
jgi:predicted GNAT family acetyltransferase